MARVSTGSRANEERETSKRIGALAALWPFVRPYRVMMVFAIVALVATATVSLVLPLAVRKVVDNFNVDESNLLDQYFAMAIVVVALLAFGTGMRYALVTRLGERVVTDIRKAVFGRVINMSPAFYDNILTRRSAKPDYNGYHADPVGDRGLCVDCAAQYVDFRWRLDDAPADVGEINWSFAVDCADCGAADFDTWATVAGAKSRKSGFHCCQFWQCLRGFKCAAGPFRPLPMRRQAGRPFDQVTEKSFEVAAQRINTRVLMTMIVIYMIFSGVVGVLWIGVHDIRSNAISAGELAQFVIYAILVAGSASALSEIWGELQRAAGATERLVELLQAQDTVTEPKNPVDLPQPLRGEIVFDDVQFRYPARPDRLSLSQINLTINPGETVALVGPSGAGKTTIIQLILRFYDPTSGQVRLDGVNLRDLRRDVFRNIVALVPQDPVVFAASALENIRFGNPEASDEKVYAAARGGGGA